MSLLVDSNQSRRADTLQAPVDPLKIDISSIDDIEKLFGKSENLSKGLELSKLVIYFKTFPAVAVFLPFNDKFKKKTIPFQYC
jgi:hypothetical protein